MAYRTWISVAILQVMFCRPGLANHLPVTPKHQVLFPMGADLAKFVWFWEKIFHTYSSQIHVIHDAWHPELIIDVLDLSSMDGSLSRKQKSEYVDKYLSRYRQALSRFKDEGIQAIHYGAMEKRILRIYNHRKETLEHLLEGQAVIRSQQGLADIFQEASLRAQNYLPYMEHIFKDEGLPPELTRMVFVESMFRLDARSKVGASGIWQFMPHTARKFITVNHIIDERNSPLKATKAASKLLKAHYQKLGHWPLAITSYNHGVNGIQRAVQAVGSTNIEKLIREYDSPSFGFASRNFYAEFLAARNIYKQYYAEQRQKTPNPLGIVAITLPRKIALSQLIRYTPLTEDILKTLNPCILPDAYDGSQRYKPLPARYSLYVPEKLAKRVKRSLHRIRN